MNYVVSQLPKIEEDELTTIAIVAKQIVEKATNLLLGTVASPRMINFN